jgi:hypothetical protein
MSINESYPGLRLIHADPDVYVIENFLNRDACEDMIKMATAKGTMDRSPVAYAGWTSDLKELLGLAASGPVSWIALFAAWYESNSNIDGGGDASVTSLVIHALRNYVVTFVLATIAILSFLRYRANGLVELRTSTSTTLDDMSHYGAREFVLRASELFDVPPPPSSASTSMAMPASYFEAPTVIRYEEGQSLAPHYDANDSANFEDANRGGQTLSTLIVYLNDVSDGGTTRFTKLKMAGGRDDIDDDGRRIDDDVRPLEIIPKMGDALLFFPADAYGNFDDRTEHEGRPAMDEKWIARIWRHEHRVPPPYGLSDTSIRDHL